jgi:hypothetical protein
VSEGWDKRCGDHHIHTNAHAHLDTRRYEAWLELEVDKDMKTYNEKEPATAE